MLESALLKYLSWTDPPPRQPSELLPVLRDPRAGDRSATRLPEGRKRFPRLQDSGRCQEEAQTSWRMKVLGSTKELGSGGILEEVLFLEVRGGDRGDVLISHHVPLFFSLSSPTFTLLSRRARRMSLAVLAARASRGHMDRRADPKEHQVRGCGTFTFGWWLALSIY